jgi:molybdopterin-guanine dinucleotide biosynthesis protein A
MELSGFVLAGGSSSRMGADKALLVFRGRTLLEHALQLAGALAGSCRIVGSRQKYENYGVVIEDVCPGHGPLAGIHAALRASTADFNLVLAVDTPLLSVDFVRHLSARAQDSGAVVIVPRTADARLHPLCAIYRRSFADVAEQALREGRNKIDALFPLVPVEYVDPAAAGFDESMFVNLNTPEDLANVG